MSPVLNHSSRNTCAVIRRKQMKSARSLPCSVGACLVALLASSFGWAQMSVEKVAATDKVLQIIRNNYNKLDVRHQKMLDGYANAVKIADSWNQYGMRLTDPSFPTRVKTAMMTSNAA